MASPPDPTDGAAVLASARLLRDLLDTDVQSYAPRIAEIEDALAACSTHPHAKRYTFDGNVYTLTLTRSGAELVNARDRKVPHEHLSLADFAAAFAAWRRERRRRD